jgi:membrane-bound ClpP family serine protease
MNTISRTITGTALIILGIILIYVSVKESLWVLIYGIPVLLIGFFILFNKREDRIESRKDMKGGKRNE